MGSLMAGWDCQFNDPESVKLRRNKSLTKEEIDAYWKSKQKIEQQHIKSISPITDSPESCAREISTEDIPKMMKYKRSSSLPKAKTEDGHFQNMVFDQPQSEKFLKSKTCWWTRSSLAYLNEPPVIDGEVPKSKYASQYHVAKLASSTKPDTRIAGL